MKKITLLGLVTLFSVFAFAQQTLVFNPRTAGLQAQNPSSLKNIDGSNIVSDGYYSPGTTMDLSFTLTITTSDAEYGDYVEMTFPTGFTVNDGTAAINPGGYDGGEVLNAISSPTISWGDDDNYYGGIAPGPYTITVNVTIDAGVTGDQTVNYFLSGDEYGGDPTTVTSTVIVQEMPADPNVYVESAGWYSNYTQIPFVQVPVLTLEAVVGNVAADQTDAFNLTFSEATQSYSDVVAVTVPLVAGSPVTLSSSTQFVPPAVGSYTINYATDNTGDVDPTDNTVDFVLNLTDTVYAKDDGTSVGGVGLNTGTGSFGNDFIIEVSDELTQIAVYFPSAGTAGDDMSFTIYPDYDPVAGTVGTAVWTSDIFDRGAANAADWTYYLVPGGLTLDPGHYVLAINQLVDGSNIGLGYTGQTPGSLLSIETGVVTEYATFGMPMLRMIMGTPVTLTDPDLEVAGGLDVQFPICPVNHMALNTYNFEATVTNNGVDLSDATNVTCAVTGTAYSEAVALTVPMAMGAEETVTFPTFTPAGIAIYEATFDAVVAADPNADDNKDTVYFEVSDTVLAREIGPNGGALSIGAGDVGTIGQTFQIAEDDTITSVTFATLGMVIGEDVYVELYDFSGTPVNLLGTTDTWTVDTDQPTAVTLSFPNAIVLTTGTYYIGVVESSANELTLASGDGEDNDYSWVYYNGSWMSGASAGFAMVYVLRANFGHDGIVGTQEIEAASEISIFPNPTTGMVRVANTDNANIFVYNLMGEVVATANNTTTIDLSNLANGTYVVKVVEGNNVVTEKVSVLK